MNTGRILLTFYCSFWQHSDHMDSNSYPCFFYKAILFLVYFRYNLRRALFTRLLNIFFNFFIRWFFIKTRICLQLFFFSNAMKIMYMDLLVFLHFLSFIYYFSIYFNLKVSVCRALPFANNHSFYLLSNGFSSFCSLFFHCFL